MSKKFVPLEKFIITCPKCGGRDIEIDTYMYNHWGSFKSHSPDSSTYYILCHDCEYEYHPGKGYYVEETNELH